MPHCTRPIACRPVGGEKVRRADSFAAPGAAAELAADLLPADLPQKLNAAAMSQAQTRSALASAGVGSRFTITTSLPWK